MLLPGQIENWVVLMDLDKRGLKNLSISSVKQVMHILQANYRCRLGVNYIVNPPKSVCMLWACIKPFLDEITIEKIKISKAPYSSDLLAHCNPHQIEEKYGGKAKNLSVFWPPSVPFHIFSADNKPMQLSEVDSYSKYQPIVEEERKKNLSPIKLERKSTTKVKVNSLDVSIAESEISIDELEADQYARSDKEDAEENLIDFEAASPFQRNYQRNPTFMMSGMRSSEEFQKKITIRQFEVENPEITGSSDSLVDFEPDPQCELLEGKVENKEILSTEGLVLEQPNTLCGCSHVRCGFSKDSCNIL